MAKYTPTQYRIYLMNSKDKHILVEGKDDKYLIERLYNDFLSQNNKEKSQKIVVDSAESLTNDDESTQSLGNCEKVRFIASSIKDKPYANNFVGFVDRELYKFECDYNCNLELQDFSKSHEVLERLVLSRGHSIENYIFDSYIFCEVLKSLSLTVYANQALNLFRETFESAIRVACSVGLAATKAQVISKTTSTIDFKLIEIKHGTEVTFKFDDWIQKLITDRQIQTNQVQDLQFNYDIYAQKVASASIDLVRWICHGHIGFEFLRALYERCVIDVCPSVQDKNKVLSEINWLAKDRLFYILINNWINKITESQYEYPIAIFELLGITLK